MFLIRKHASTSNIFRILLRHSTTGQGLTGLTFSSTGLIISTINDNEATPTAYTAAGSTIETVTTLGTFAAPTAPKVRFREVDATNHPGLYEVQIADARFAVASAKILRIAVSGATNMLGRGIAIQFDPVPSDVTHLLGTGWLAPAVAGCADVNTKTLSTGAITASSIAADAITDAKVAADVTIASVTGAVGSVTGNIGGSVAGSVGSVTGAVGSVNAGVTVAVISANVITAASIADGAIDTATFAAGTTIPRVTLADTLTTYTNNTTQTGDSFARIGAAGVGLTAVALASATSDAVIAGAIWNAATITYGSAGSYGLLIETNIDGTISSRLATAGYTAPSNLTAAQIATGVWQDTTATDFTVALSVGKSVMNGVTLGTGLTIVSVSGAVGSVTGAVGSVIGNLGGNINGNILGSTGSVTGSVGSVVGSVGGNLAGSVLGNVSGSVGSVTGAVGSVAGAVGSVTGNVGGSTASVTGAVGSVTGDVSGNVAGKVLGGGVGSITGDGVRAASVTGAVGSVTGFSPGDITTLLGRITAPVYTMFTDLIAMITGTGASAKLTTVALSNAPGGSGSITQGDINSIIAGVQSVSTGIIAAQDSSALYITKGDTWVQDINTLGNLTGKTILFAIKSSMHDADTASIVYIEKIVGLTRLGGAVASNAAWGSITILNETLGNIRITLASNATALLKSGTYVDAVKVIVAGTNSTLRQRGKTIVSAGVIRTIT